MKHFFLFVFICFIHFNYCFGQSERLNLKMHNVALREALSAVEQNSEYRFFFSDDFVALNSKVNLDAVNADIIEVLTQILSTTQLTYKILEKNLVIIMPDQEKKNRVSGVLLDNEGEPLSGANIMIKGSKIRTITDSEGRYSLELPSANSVLIFSYIGYVTKEIEIGKQKSYKIILPEDPRRLDEIVVVGFGTQKKVNLTGAVATVNVASFDENPVANMGQALHGLVPGLNITQSGQYGGSLEGRPSINIRGIATIGTGSTGNPLILIDGMEGDLNTVNPMDVESISVLKDAASSSIYGSRAPFGVILVTTKTGKAGKTKITYDASFRSSSPLSLPKMMDSYDFALYFNAANSNSGFGDLFNAERMQRIISYQNGNLGSKTNIVSPSNPQYWADGYACANDNVDWFRAIYKSSAPSQNHALSINGGSENLTYYLSTNYLDQVGLMNFGGDNYQRYTTTAKIDAKLSKSVSITYNARFTRETYERPANLTNTLNTDIARQGWPVLPLYDPNGYLFASPSPALGLRDGGRDKKQDDWIYQQVKLLITPLKGWNIIGNINYKTNDNFRHWDTEKTYNHDANGDPVLYGNSSSVHEEALRTNYFSPNIYSDYSRKFGESNLKLMVGFQSELNKYRFLSADRQGVIVPSSPVLDITSGTSNSGSIVSPEVKGSYTDWATEGLFGRFNYDYKEKYLIETNLRYDGTSRFRQDNRWNFFPSASIGWNISKEKFWNPLGKIINTFKIRASYGELGNQNTTILYPTYTVMPAGTSNGNWLIGGTRPNTSSAPGIISSSLSWEKVRTYDFGTDFGLLNNRLTSSYDIFIRFTNNMVGPAPLLPSILGTAVPTTNNTDLKTYGFEFDLKWQDRLANGFGYNIHFVLSDSQTKIEKYPNPNGNLGNADNIIYHAGQSIGEIWGYTSIGIAKTQQEMHAHLATLPDGGQNAVGTNWSAGDIMYKDLNGDHKIDNGANTTKDHGDLSIIGNSTPRYSVGLDFSADWKGFDFRTFFQGILKRDFFQNSYYFWGASGRGVWWSTGLVQQQDYFRDDPANPLGVNPNAYYPRPLFSDKNQQIQTRYLQNAAYLRLKTLQIGYTIPVEISKKAFIQKIRIYFSGENILTFTHMSSIFDPETIDGGWGGNIYPISKVYSVGVSISI